MMHKSLMLALAALSTLALAAGTSYSVIVNGQVAPDGAIVVNGKTYVPLSALKLLGVNSSLKGTTLTLGAQAASAPGGANQRASLEGCLGETLFNGVWRLTVRAPRPISRYNGQNAGYAVPLEWKNGTAKAINGLNTGVGAPMLALSDGTTLSAENDQDLTQKTLLQAAGANLTLNFWADSAQTKAGLAQPAKLLVQIDPRVIGGSLSEGLRYPVPDPSFRVNLGCQK